MPSAIPENLMVENKEIISSDELYAVTKDYPYYPVAQFKLLSILSRNKDEFYITQGSKTALFFSNAKWMHYQLLIESEYHDNKINLIKTNELQESALSEIENFSKPENVHSNTNPEESLSVNPIHIISQKTEDTVDQIAFEPLHTVDYFASQGIKTTDEIVTNDKLGKQLKSFTEWLKSMKKVHLKDLASYDEQGDKIIQHIAEVSNADSNIVTEAMAEVLIKQNKIANAIEMYEKLSLNYPAKSAYFAGKIKSLNSV